MRHFTSKILMISPNKFRNNEYTHSDNVFQSKKTNENDVQSQALKEFNRLREIISKSGIEVFSFDDDSEFDTPDAVFPNNWISFHQQHKAILYPMFSPNRRFERESKILDKLSRSGIEIELIKNYSIHEDENRFLEGTGSIFNSTHLSKPIYHTNVMMSICNKFAIICLDSITDKNERNNVTENLNNSGLEIIDISVNQMTSFLGNCIQLINSDQSPILIMSSRAFNSISKSQLKRIESQTEIIHSEIKTIENNGGGSARCMIAEVF